MKKAIVFALAVVLVLGFAGMAFAGISNSKHDLTSGTTDGRGTGTQQICVFCHHPHRGAAPTGNTNVVNDLLWNIASFSQTVYNTYVSTGSTNSQGMDTNVTKADSLATYLCMACHDGNLAAGSLVALPKDGNGSNMSSVDMSAANLGTTLRDDHPVNFTYPSEDSRAGDTIVKNTNNWITGNVSAVAAYPLFNGKMQCGTCHDVHMGGADSASNSLDFMRGNTVGSEICVDCHLKK